MSDPAGVAASEPQGPIAGGHTSTGQLLCVQEG
jgi:hypothetical protein